MESENKASRITPVDALIWMFSLLPVVEIILFRTIAWYVIVAAILSFAWVKLSLETFRSLRKRSGLYSLLGYLVLFQCIFIVVIYGLLRLASPDEARLLFANVVVIPKAAFWYYAAYLASPIKVLLFSACVGVLVLLKYYFDRSWLASYFVGASMLYAISLFLIFGLYYDIPLAHSERDILAQPSHSIIEFRNPRAAGRRMAIDQDEEFLYASFFTSFGARASGLNGLCKFDLRSGHETRCYNRGGAGLVLPDGSDKIYLSIYKRRIVELNRHSLAATGRFFDIGPGLDKIELLDNNTIAAQSELPSDHDIYFIDIPSGKIWPSQISKIPGFSVNNTIEPHPAQPQAFAFQNNLEQHRLVKVAKDGKELASVDLDFSIEVFFAPVSQKVYVPSFYQDLMYVVDPETLSHRNVKMKRIIREIVEYPDGKVLLLANYLTGEIYVYSIAEERIKKILLTGRKPEAMAIGPKTGKLYVASHLGVHIFDLPSLLGR